jgi:hypothetical protein
MHARLLLAAAASLALAACAEPMTGPQSIEEFEPEFALVDRPFLPGPQQPLVDLARGFTYAIYPPGEGQILAQTFTPGRRRLLGYLQIPVGCSAGVLLNTKIRDGLVGTILYEANHAGLPEVVDGDFELLQVYNPATSNGIPLVAGRTYAFELSAFPGPTATSRTCGLAPGPAGNSYRGGRGWYQDPINGPNFLPLPNGNRRDNEDLPFIALVR